MKIRISDIRVAPMVRRMAMSLVLARTSMISDDRMLNTATRMMIDSTQNITTRSTFSASNSEAFIACQSVTTACPATLRSEEHTSELQSLMRISYAVFCLQKKTQHTTNVTELRLPKEYS